MVAGFGEITRPVAFASVTLSDAVVEIPPEAAVMVVVPGPATPVASAPDGSLEARLHAMGHAYAFVDFRGHVFRDRKYAVNVGMGFRNFPRKASRAFGLNAFYDYRRQRHHSFHQIGLGLESLGPIWDFFANGYAPILHTRSAPFDTETYLRDDEIIFEAKRDLAMYGVDAETGVHMYRWHGVDLYLGAGPYYFNRGHRNAPGGKGRLTFRYTGKSGAYVALEGTASYDSRFKDIYQGQVTLSFPFCRGRALKKNEHKGSCSDFIALQQRLLLPVVRDEIIVIERTKKRSTLVID